MKKVEHYYCELCNTMYNDRNTATACEKSHKIPNMVGAKRYLSKAQNDQGYPETVEVAFTDGTTAIYHR